MVHSRRSVAADAAPTNTVGMNTFSWNLRESDATTFNGMIMWAGVLTGPLVLPGNYSVRLLVDGAPVSDAKLLVK